MNKVKCISGFAAALYVVTVCNEACVLLFTNKRYCQQIAMIQSLSTFALLEWRRGKGGGGMEEGEGNGGSRWRWVHRPAAVSAPIHRLIPSSSLQGLSKSSHSAILNSACSYLLLLPHSLMLLMDVCTFRPATLNHPT